MPQSSPWRSSDTLHLELPHRRHVENFTQGTATDMAGIDHVRPHLPLLDDGLLVLENWLRRYG